MKQIKLDATTWNPLFMDFCNHHGIVPKTHRPYRARTKGKVERMVSYVKSNFLNGRTFADLSDLNAQARHWLSQTANVRLHGTTNERPVDLWPKEGLTSLRSVAPYQFYESVECKVDYEGFVRFDRSRYSVQPELAGTKVWVGKRDFKIVVHCGDLIVVEHEPAEKPGMTVTKPEHIAAMWQLSLKRAPAPIPKWSLTFDESVVSTPLTKYEEAGQ
jgi:hypothetical protein